MPERHSSGGRTITDVIFHVFCPQLKVKEVVLLFSSTTIKRLGDGVRQRLANIPPKYFSDQLGGHLAEQSVTAWREG